MPSLPPTLTLTCGLLISGGAGGDDKVKALAWKKDVEKEEGDGVGEEEGKEEGGGGDDLTKMGCPSNCLPWRRKERQTDRRIEGQTWIEEAGCMTGWCLVEPIEGQRPPSLTLEGDGGSGQTPPGGHMI